MKSSSQSRFSRGQIIGLITISVATVVSGAILWLEKESRSTVNTAASVVEEQLPGFAKEFWYLPDDALLGFVSIPAGEFLMGSDPAIDHQAYDNELWSRQPRRGRLSVPGFFIGRYEITVAQYKAFTTSSGHAVVPKALAAPLDHPVTQVTFTDALAYCRWLETQMRSSNNLPGQLKEKLAQGWRVTLPSEAQWEKAARGTDGRIFPWGNQATTTFAHYGADRTRPVGNKNCPNCVYGLADMSGNVWELTRSYYLPYPFSEYVQPNLESDALFVMRGGSYADAATNVRAAVRGGVDPGVRGETIGFRIVLSEN